jgi:hypothetical protein
VGLYRTGPVHPESVWTSRFTQPMRFSTPPSTPAVEDLLTEGYERLPETGAPLRGNEPPEGEEVGRS